MKHERFFEKAEWELCVSKYMIEFSPTSGLSHDVRVYILRRTRNIPIGTKKFSLFLIEIPESGS